VAGSGLKEPSRVTSAGANGSGQVRSVEIFDGAGFGTRAVVTGSAKTGSISTPWAIRSPTACPDAA